MGLQASPKPIDCRPYIRYGTIIAEAYYSLVYGLAMGYKSEPGLWAYIPVLYSLSVLVHDGNFHGNSHGSSYENIAWCTRTLRPGLARDLASLSLGIIVLEPLVLGPS